MACIGAFLGWEAVLFTVTAASVIGALTGILTALIGRREWSAKIPFGPYLSLAALLWIFNGPEFMALWLGFYGTPEELGGGTP
jgi:leader peptidase (prepilin peptidase)/N-methyltransferase